jgi:hypothetical protein
MAPEEALRLAGYLPPVPPEVAEEQEARQLFRSLDRNLRRSILATMRSLLGLSTVPAESGTEGRRASPESGRAGADGASPDPLHDWLAEQLAQQLVDMHPDDQRAVFELMKRIRAREEARGAGGLEDVPTASA